MLILETYLVNNFCDCLLCCHRSCVMCHMLMFFVKTVSLFVFVLVFVSWDMLNNFCFHVYAPKWLFICENDNGYFLTSPPPRPWESGTWHEIHRLWSHRSSRSFLNLNPLSGVLLTRIFSINEHLLLQSTVHRSERYKLQIESINQYKRRTHELIIVLRSVSPQRGMKGIALVRKTHFFFFNFWLVLRSCQTMILFCRLSRKECLTYSSRYILYREGMNFTL